MSKIFLWGLKKLFYQFAAQSCFYQKCIWFNYIL